MIVQDDFLLRMETAAHLRQWGYDVVEAFSEAEARRALHADRRIALVLLDVKVGRDQSGLELARWIGGHYPQTKLLLTAAVAPMAEGFPVLDKPYRPLDLLQRIDALLTPAGSRPSLTEGRAVRVIVWQRAGGSEASSLSGQSFNARPWPHAN